VKGGGTGGSHWGGGIREKKGPSTRWENSSRFKEGGMVKKQNLLRSKQGKGTVRRRGAAKQLYRHRGKKGWGNVIEKNERRQNRQNKTKKSV